MKIDLERPSDHKIGIVGCGHLGQALAQALIRGGLDKEKLLISYRGNSLTLKRLEEWGLASCLAANDVIFSECAVVIITVRPQDLSTLKESAAKSGALIASCAAGVPLETLGDIFGENVIRIMLSGPDTIAVGRSLAAVFPENESMKRLFGLMGIKLIKIHAESELDVFTAGVCLTAALLKTESPSEEERAIEIIGEEYPLLKELYAWAKKALPEFKSEEEKRKYISKMATEGGVTYAIISALEQGVSLDAALKRGIARTGEISLEIKRALLARED